MTRQMHERYSKVNGIRLRCSTLYLRIIRERRVTVEKICCTNATPRTMEVYSESNVQSCGLQMTHLCHIQSSSLINEYVHFSHGISSMNGRGVVSVDASRMRRALYFLQMNCSYSCRVAKYVAIISTICEQLISVQRYCKLTQFVLVDRRSDFIQVHLCCEHYSHYRVIP